MSSLLLTLHLSHYQILLAFPSNYIANPVTMISRTTLIHIHFWPELLQIFVVFLIYPFPPSVFFQHSQNDLLKLDWNNFTFSQNPPTLFSSVSEWKSEYLDIYSWPSPPAVINTSFLNPFPPLHLHVFLGPSNILVTFSVQSLCSCHSICLENGLTYQFLCAIFLTSQSKNLVYHLEIF